MSIGLFEDAAIYLTKKLLGEDKPKTIVINFLKIVLGLGLGAIVSRLLSVSSHQKADEDRYNIARRPQTRPGKGVFASFST